MEGKVKKIDPGSDPVYEELSANGSLKKVIEIALIVLVCMFVIFIALTLFSDLFESIFNEGMGNWKSKYLD